MVSWMFLRQTGVLSCWTLEKEREDVDLPDLVIDIVGFLRKELRFFGLPMIFKMIVVPLYRTMVVNFPV